MCHGFWPFPPVIFTPALPYLSFLLSSLPFGSFPLHPLHGFNFFCSITYVFLLFFFNPQSIISSRFSSSTALFCKSDISSLHLYLDGWVSWGNRICSHSALRSFHLCPPPILFSFRLFLLEHVAYDLPSLPLYAQGLQRLNLQLDFRKIGGEMERRGQL